MSFKKAKVVMLSTNQKADLSLGNSSKGTLIYHKYTKPDYTKRTYQHLYILSDDEIKEGDWYIDNRNFNEPIISNTPIHEDKAFACKKIIATTDTSIGYTDNRVSPVPNFCTYPQLSQSFIEKYVKSYNAGNPITDVLAEYETIEVGTNSGLEPERVKVSPKDNTITIKKMKDSWSREEVEDLISLAWATCSATIYREGDSIEKDCKSWIENNL